MKKTENTPEPQRFTRYCNLGDMPSPREDGAAKKGGLPKSDSGLQDLFGDPIHTYSRAEALRDGMLIDASEMAKQAGFKVPVALTHAVWEAYVEIPEGVTGQDVQGRLWDILFMAAFQARGINDNVILFSLHVRTDNRRPQPVQLKLMMGPGDQMEPVITILLPDED